MPSRPAPDGRGKAGATAPIDLDRVEGRMKASVARKVGEIVERHPEDAAAIIRSWLNQD